MIKFEHPEVWGWEHAIRGMRNPMNSWERSDTTFGLGEDYLADMKLGQNDVDLMLRLIGGGSPHRKFLRQIFVSVDITAPLYWWKEFDTYKVGTVANSCSTMHKIHAKEFTLEDFSCEHLLWSDNNMSDEDIPVKVMENLIYVLNHYRSVFLDTKDKTHWWQMIQLLPSSYNQKRTVMLNYEVLSNIYQYRREHKLDEWREFCQWIEQLPYSEIVTCNVREKSD